MTLTLAVISDLHCHHSTQDGPAKTILVTDAKKNPISQHPVEALRELVIQSGIKADALIVTGDLTNAVDVQGMLSAWDFIKDIASFLHVSVIVPTIGNHDIIFKERVSDPCILLKDYLTNPQFPTDNKGLNDCFWSNGYFIIESKDWRILSINSTLGYLDDKSIKRGLISTTHISEIKSAIKKLDKKLFQVAICHHHPILHENLGLGTDDVMENGGLLTDALSDLNFSLLIHGHKHHPRLKYDVCSKMLPIFASGSFSAILTNGLASRTRNLFHIITLSQSQLGSGVVGRIKTWQFQQGNGWKPATNDSCDFPFETGFGCNVSETDIAEKICAIYKKSGQPLCKWSEICDKLPDVNYLIPSQFCRIKSILLESNIMMLPSPPDLPEIIGLKS
jgi:hypothetical protein